MEHAVSDMLVDRIDAFLGYPKSDPHGDPIPGPDGSLDNPGNAQSCRVPGGRRISPDAGGRPVSRRNSYAS